ncbi:MAG: FtsX-like permease family protein, partial [Bacteroidota bacterium]
GLPINFPIFQSANFWITFLAFLLLGILLSGAYPALLLSSFPPSSVLKGSYGHSAKGVFLRKSLVIFQFAITIILLIQTFTVFEQLDFMRSIDLGLNVNQTVVVKAPAADEKSSSYNAFKQALLQRAEVENVALSSVVPGQPSSQFSTTTGINLPNAVIEHNYNFYIGGIDKDFLGVMDIELVAGENFTEQINRELPSIIVNEKALELWEITDTEAAIGQTLNFWGNTWTIRGVISNYAQNAPKSPPIPIIYRQEEDFDEFASIKFNNQNPQAQIAAVEQIFKTTFPNSPFSFFFLDSEYDKQFKADERFRDVFSILTIVAIIIACLGLFGLASFTVAKRTKEIGIRKVIGASTFSIMYLLTKDFLKTVGIALLIGFPITYFLISNWLNNFATRIELGGHLFVLPAILVLVLVVLSLSIKTIQTATANPIDCLKEE